MTPSSRWLPSPDRPRSLVALRIAIAIVLVVGVVGCVVKSANKPADPYLSSGPEPPAVTRTSLPGFGETRIQVRNGDQLVAWCLLLAATEAQRNRGLMQVADPALGGYDGMLFRFPVDSNEQFYMYKTVLPLTVAFVRSDGHLVSSSDMPPCPSDDPKACPNFPAAGPYRFAIEVPQGGLGRLGIGPDAVVADLNQPC